MNPLEASYRRLLRAYPRSWREDRGEELLAVLLEWAPDHQVRPSAGDALNLVVNGLRARLVGAGRSVPRVLLDRVSLVSLASGAAISLLCLGAGEIPRQQSPIYRSLLTIAPMYTLGAVLYVLWLATVVLLVTGVIRNARRAAGVLFAVTGLVSLTSVAARWSIMSAPPLSLVAFFAMLAGTSLAAPRIMTRAGRTVLGVATIALTAAVAHTYSDVFWGNPASGGFDYYRAALPMWVHQSTWEVVPVLLLGGAVASIRRPGWLLAVALSSVPWALLTVTYIAWPGQSLFLPGALLAALGFLTVLVRDGLRASGRTPQVPLR